MSADAVTFAALEQPVLFGKLPAHGDFVGRGLSTSGRAQLDTWLSEWLSAAQAMHGEAFAARYADAAPWLFEGARAVAVLLPSVDAVGRLFPLLAIAAPGTAIQAIYDAMLEAVETAVDCDSLHATLAALEPGDAPAGTAPGWFLPEGAERHLPPPDGVPSWRLVEGGFV